MSPIEMKSDSASDAPPVFHDDGDATIDLAMAGAMLRRQWPVIVLITGLFLGCALAYSVVAPKTWRASTRVLLDPRDKQLVGNDVARPMQSTELGWVETRLELVKSFDNLTAVVERERLVDDPEILEPDGNASPQERTALAVRALAEMVLVERPKENNLLDVTVTTRDPEKAARLSQAVAQAFVDGLARSKVEQIEKANGLLARQVDGMRRKMSEAEARVEEYKRTNGITVTRGNLVDEETMRQVNENLIAARQKAQEAKERWERLRKAVDGGDARIASQSDSVGSAVLGRLKIEASLAERRKTEAEQKYGPRHPDVLAAAAEVERTRSAIRDEMKSFAATAELDYQIARANEDNVRKNLDGAQARLAETGQAVVALQELENEAQARRDLYKSFVARMEETNLQKNTQVSDASIVSPAQVPLRPFSPRRGLALALALVAGLGVGLSVALYRGRNLVIGKRRRPLAAPAPIVAAPVSGVVVAPVAEAAPEVAPSVEPVAAGIESPPLLAPAPAAPGAPVVSTPEALAAVEATAPSVVDVAPVADAPAPPADLVEDEASPLAPLPARIAERRSPPARVDLALLPERLARLATDSGPGTGVSALVETASGTIDVEGLAMLRRLADELGRNDATQVRLIFSNTVAAKTTAALSLGLCRAEADVGGRIVLLDLAADPAPLASAFEAAEALPGADMPAFAGFELRRDAAGVVLARPTAAFAEVPVVDRGERQSDFIDAVLHDYDEMVVHLGWSPKAASLLDAAADADHVLLVLDGKDLAQEEVRGEIEMMSELLARFDAMLVLDVADVDTGRRSQRRLRRRA